MVELLAPAGSTEALDSAIGEGADAVYLGLKSFNARLRSTNFAWNQAEAATDMLHKAGKKIYITVNTVFCEKEAERIYRFLEYLVRLEVDGIIVQDFGIIRMCKQFFPTLRLHASTQMNIASSFGANLLGKQGVRRVVLARELNLKEVQDIKANTNVELEVFVHGALCISESGLCLFSSFLGGKSANRGMCTQACRRLYSTQMLAKDCEGYYFSPYDLQLVDYIPDLADCGVESFKIEGRMKSAEYVGAVVRAYRFLLDNYKSDKKGAIATAKRILSSDFARKKTVYFYGKDAKEAIKTVGESVLNPEQAGGTGLYLGQITKVEAAPEYVEEAYKKTLENTAKKDLPPTVKVALVSGANYVPEVGDSLRFHKTNDAGRISYKIKYVVPEKDGRFYVDVPQGFGTGTSVYLLQMKTQSKRYRHVLPEKLSVYRKQPLDGILPVLDMTPVKKDELSYFPQGLYFAVSSVKDVFIVNAFTPVRILMELNYETTPLLTSDSVHFPLPHKHIIINLDPYCPQDSEESLFKILKRLYSLGYETFVANNLSHIYMLKQLGANIIAGPYLYTFNRWALSFFDNQNIGAFITPIENSRDNLLATFDITQRQRCMVSIFSYPQLFRIRFMLPESYDFTYFSDKEGSEFKVNSTIDGSFVMGEKPFSIVDRANYLKGVGFKRLLIDYSKTKATKQDIKVIVSSTREGKNLPDTMRFNWKEGFYDSEQVAHYKELSQNQNHESFSRKSQKKHYKK